MQIDRNRLITSRPDGHHLHPGDERRGMRRQTQDPLLGYPDETDTTLLPDSVSAFTFDHSDISPLFFINALAIVCNI